MFQIQWNCSFYFFFPIYVITFGVFFINHLLCRCSAWGCCAECLIVSPRILTTLRWGQETVPMPVWRVKCLKLTEVNTHCHKAVSGRGRIRTHIFFYCLFPWSGFLMAGLSGILLFHCTEWSDWGTWKVLSRRSFSSGQISALTPFTSLLCPQTSTHTHIPLLISLPNFSEKTTQSRVRLLVGECWPHVCL